MISQVGGQWRWLQRAGFIELWPDLPGHTRVGSSESAWAQPVLQNQQPVTLTIVTISPLYHYIILYHTVSTYNIYRLYPISLGNSQHIPVGIKEVASNSHLAAEFDLPMRTTATTACDLDSKPSWPLLDGEGPNVELGDPQFRGMIIAFPYFLLFSPSNWLFKMLFDAVCVSFVYPLLFNSMCCKSLLNSPDFVAGV